MLLDTYVCETLAIGEAARKRLEAFEMWSYRRLNGRIELQTRKLWIELDKKEHYEKKSEEGKSSDDTAHFMTLGGLLRNRGEVGKREVWKEKT